MPLMAEPILGEGVLFFFYALFSNPGPVVNFKVQDRKIYDPNGIRTRVITVKG